ncbi:MAG: TIGR00303 family protein [Gomphosphaeria aponina SAG 52.96 = DSM 107014]|uniref:UPF0284 protein DSM107014_02960 n=1 Tax=Gomphosphaeria aponina SAG 52.96 = DSM 107014 TaxID=1521640 RepID=A0A941JSI3_9CHRO|nr:TIGR00303 family protein [Gomphosphaeria aponina SAG 52.96 = DSM 107014]
MIHIYTQIKRGNGWLEENRGRHPVFACILGLTATGLIPGISAAGATPADRQYTAVADAEFLVNGVRKEPTFPLPPLNVGASPVFISRAVVEALNIPVFVFDAGLPFPPAVPAISLSGMPANCITSGKALPLNIVEHLFAQGKFWGEKLALDATGGYVILGECVVGGTTTAQAVLTGLGFEVAGKVNSSHPHCNHAQKLAVVQAGLQQFTGNNPLELIAAVGDPMQIVVAGMAIAASRHVGVLLAGGTQMLAVYALIQRICAFFGENAHLEQMVVGTTRWVAEDPTGDTVGLAQLIGEVPLVATCLSFAHSRYPLFQVYEEGFVKEGVGAGGLACAAHLAYGLTPFQLLTVIESLFASYLRVNSIS